MKEASVKTNLPSGFGQRLGSSIRSVQQWVEAQGYKGYDPADGLTTPLRRLTFGNLFAERLLQQFVWKFPLNVRPLIGIKPLDSTKGRGFMAWGYMLLHQMNGDLEAKSKALENLRWLQGHTSPKYQHPSWGNHFDFTTRSGRMPAHESTIVWSSLIAHAFLEAYEQIGDGSLLQTIQGICRWILDLPREKTRSGSCLSYVAYGQSSIHNSNLLGAGVLGRAYRHTKDPEYLEVAREAVRYTCSRQLPDGGWWYGEHPKYHWNDNFHTGYNLDSLKYYTKGTGDSSFQQHIDKGFDYFIRTFFESSGRPRYYHNRTYPIDIQCCSQAIDSLANFSDDYPGSLDLARKVAAWTIENMQDKEGFFHYRKYPLTTAKTPYFHWGQATMFKAMARLQLQIFKSA
jgi:hypothetical protein